MDCPYCGSQLTAPLLQLGGATPHCDPTRPFDKDERLAIGLYAVANRDFCDFLDYIMDKEETNARTLCILLEMVTREDNPKLSASDIELNRLMRGPVKKQLELRRP